MDDKLYETTWNLVTQREGVLRGTMDDIFHKKLKPTTHTACEDLDLVAHYNPDHVKHKRQTTIQQPDPAQIPVVRPFDPNGFHFNKASPREIMMKLTLGQNPTVVLAALQEENQQQEGTGGDGGPETDEEQAIHTLFVNVSPLAHGHSLLVPWMEEMLPQRLTKASIILSLRLCRLSKREDFKIGYNSLGAFASVNHLHFQPFYTCLSFDKPGMPVEYSEKLRIYPTDDDNGSGNGTVHIHALTNWPISGWVFTLVADSIDDGKLQYLGIQVNELVQRLITLDVAHNLLFCDGGRSVYILPRKKQRVIGKDYVRIAMIEASGLAVCRDEEAFQELDGDMYVSAMQEFCMPTDWLNEQNNWIRTSLPVKTD